MGAGRVSRVLVVPQGVLMVTVCILGRTGEMIRQVQGGLWAVRTGQRSGLCGGAAAGLPTVPAAAIVVSATMTRTELAIDGQDRSGGPWPAIICRSVTFYTNRACGR